MLGGALHERTVDFGRPKLLEHAFCMERQALLVLDGGGRLQSRAALAREQQERLHNLTQFVASLEERVTAVERVRNDVWDALFRGCDLVDGALLHIGLALCTDVEEQCHELRRRLSLLRLRALLKTCAVTVGEHQTRLDRMVKDHLRGFVDESLEELVVLLRLDPTVRRLASARIVERMRSRSLGERIGHLRGLLAVRMDDLRGLVEELARDVFESLRRMADGSEMVERSLALLDALAAAEMSATAIGEYCLMVFVGSRRMMLASETHFARLLRLLQLPALTRTPHYDSLVTSLTTRMRSFVAHNATGDWVVACNTLQFLAVFVARGLTCVVQFAEAVLRQQIFSAAVLFDDARTRQLCYALLAALLGATGQRFSSSVFGAVLACERERGRRRELVDAMSRVFSADMDWHVLLDALVDDGGGDFDAGDSLHLSLVDRVLSLADQVARIQALYPVLVREFKRRVGASLLPGVLTGVLTGVLPGVLTGVVGRAGAVLLSHARITLAELMRVFGPNAAQDGDRWETRSAHCRVYGEWLACPLETAVATQLRSVLHPRHAPDFWLRSLLDAEEYGQTALLSVLLRMEGLREFELPTRMECLRAMELPGRFICTALGAFNYGGLALRADAAHHWMHLLAVARYAVEETRNGLAVRDELVALLARHLPEQMERTELVLALYHIAYATEDTPVSVSVLLQRRSPGRLVQLVSDAGSLVRLLGALRRGEGCVSLGQLLGMYGDLVGEASGGNMAAFSGQLALLAGIEAMTGPSSVSFLLLPVWRDLEWTLSRYSEGEHAARLYRSLVLLGRVRLTRLPRWICELVQQLLARLADAVGSRNVSLNLLTMSAQEDVEEQLVLRMNQLVDPVCLRDAIDGTRVMLFATADSMTCLCQLAWLIARLEHDGTRLAEFVSSLRGTHPASRMYLDVLFPQ